MSERANDQAEPGTLTFGDIAYPHRIGDPKCGQGWCGRDYPTPCKCGGLIHANFGDENASGDYWLWTKCDRCGESE